MAQALDYSLRAWDSTLCVRGTVLFACVGQYSLRAWDSTLCVRGTVAPGVFSLRRLASACISINIEEECMYTCKYFEDEGMHVYIQRSRAVSMHMYRGGGPLGVGRLAFS